MSTFAIVMAVVAVVAASVVWAQPLEFESLAPSLEDKRSPALTPGAATPAKATRGGCTPTKTATVPCGYGSSPTWR